MKYLIIFIIIKSIPRGQQNLAQWTWWKFTLTPERYQKKEIPSIKINGVLRIKNKNKKTGFCRKKNPKVSQKVTESSFVGVEEITLTPKGYQKTLE